MVQTPLASRAKSSQINEEGIIGQIRRRFSCTNSQLLVGLGDDAAVVSPRQDAGLAKPLNVRSQVLATDILIEGVHFSLDYMSLSEIGYKAVAVNVSDMAAMGAECVYALGNLGVPRDADSDDISSLLDGVSEALNEFGASLIGGDTVRSPQWLMSFSLIGSIESPPLLRSGAQAGDVIWHSGDIGLSQVGFHQLQAGTARENSLARRAHVRPRPMLELGQWLSSECLATSCLDLSDSLSQCLLQLATASNVGMRIDLADYALHPELLEFLAELPDKTGTRQGIRIPADMQGDQEAADYASTAEFLLSCAEDYQLLFTADPAVTQRLLGESPIPLRRLGTVVPAAEGLLYCDERGESHQLSRLGYAH
jgi:thiamine-monophosphate kinase